MPELPEVEVCRLNIVRWLNNNPIQKVTILDSRLLQEGHPSEIEKAMIDTEGEGWHRHGKVLLWHQPGHGALGIHLRMTGRMSLVQKNDSLPAHSRAFFQLLSGEKMAFTDVRRLGKWWWGQEQEVKEWSGCHRHGPDALLHPMTATEFLERTQKTRRPLKILLLDQAVLAGIGNIAASEICFRARIDPRVPANELTQPHATRLLHAIGQYLEDSIERDRGTEIVYQGEKNAANPFQIYGRSGAPCPQCDAPIQSKTLGGRSTFWCDQCQ